MHIRKGDSVQVITGSDKGKIGRVLKVYPDKDRLLVEGVRMITKHMRPTEQNPQGGRQEKESNIHISNVMLVVNGEPTKIGYKILDNGKKVRISKKNQEIVD